MQTLQRDSTGDDVRNWQTFLISQGLLEASGADGIFGPKTEHATKVFQRAHALADDGIVGKRTQAAAASLGFVDVLSGDGASGNGLNHNSLNLLAKVHPRLRQRIVEVARIMVQRNPSIRCVVTSGLRTFEEQEHIYAQGRTRPGPIVSNARPGQSYHNYGLAVDLASLKGNTIDWSDTSPNWAIMGAEGQRLGLEWGGAWTSFVDRPHWQLTTGLRLSQCLEHYNRGGVNAVWAAVDQRLALEHLGTESGEEVE